MLTMDTLDAYAHFGGDIDAKARMRGGGVVAVSDEDWYLIDDLIQRLGLVQAGLASPAFAAKTEQHLQAVTADEPTRDRLRQMAARARAGG
ncbi:hypothetical protein [Azoarcus olearius]|uniref:Uncharacterized protein n=1 Tax=Azoarcus sp. (strain BH72) TaxID=418699 RepID=A1KA65_AZOSB|nr:hypothetical protein [Azoarcus olearius]ANQ86263.1 hypothetical protein dqs_3235 [Azoarcus olearius]CAL95721.1 hypothetical protein predicted by Glimmer/Critica [Azoarcus olearius]